MTSMLNPLLQKWLGVLVRSGLTAVGAYLVGEGWTSTDDWTNTAMALTPILVSVLWSAYEKVTAMAATEIAKTSVSTTTKAELKAVLDDTSFGAKCSMAANPQ